MEDKLTAKEFQSKIKSGEIEVGAKGRLVKNTKNPQVMQNSFNSKQKVKNRKYVDINLQPINEKIGVWRKTHPDEIYFDSLLEGKFYHFMKSHDIEFHMKLKVDLQPNFNYLGHKVKPITWTPDYVIKNPFQYIIIDTKGYSTDVFDVKYKMIMHHFYSVGTLRKLTNLPHIWFVRTPKMFPIALNSINRVLKNKNLDGIHSQLLFENVFKKKKKYGTK